MFRESRVSFFALLLFLIPVTGLQAQPGTWIVGGGSELNEDPIALVSDGDGNVYGLVSFTDTLKFMGNTIPSKGEQNLFLFKLNPDGNLLWYDVYGSWSLTWGRDMILVDSVLHISGMFRDSTIIGTDTIFSSYLQNNKTFPVGLHFEVDTAGNYLRHSRTNGPGTEDLRSLAIDGSGNKYFTGNFRDIGIVQYDTVRSRGKDDVYLFSLDSANFRRWIAHAGGAFTDVGTKIEVYQDSLLLTCGNFQDTAYFTDDSSVSRVAVKEDDFFLMAHDTAGNFLWVVTGGGNGKDLASSMDLSQTGDLYMSVIFDSSITFKGLGYTSRGGNDALIIKMDTDANIQWIKQIGGPGFDGIYQLAARQGGGVVIAAYFQDTLVIDGDSLKTGPFDSDAFVAAFDGSGSLEWLNYGGSSGLDEGRAVTEDNSGNVFFAGRYSDGYQMGQSSLSSVGAYDFFISKLNSSGSVHLDSKIEERPFIIYPNPASDYINITPKYGTAAEIEAVVYGMKGEKLIEKKGTTSSISDLRIETAGLKNGIYFLKISDGVDQVYFRLLIRHGDY